MCLLILKPAGKTIPTKFLQNAHQSNPHGCGVAVASEGKLKIQKSSRWSSDEIDKVLKNNISAPAIVHFRWATHGSKTFDNTHPFKLNDNWVAAHNGVIPNMETLNDESDTRAFLRQHVIPLLEVGVRLDDKDILTMLGTSMGNANKMTFLSADGSYGIANESAGHWNNGVWYSNNSYEDYTPPAPRVWAPRSQRGYAGGWQDAWEGEDTDAYFSSTSQSRFRRGKGKRIDVIPFATEGDEDDTYDEAWHTFDVTSLWCDNCNQRVIEEFRIESRSGLCYCHRCYDQI